jgi:3-oxoacyl-[acyl-carrier protein] reductase
MNGRDPSILASAVAELSDTGADVFGFAGDVGIQEDVAQLFIAAIGMYGRVDVLVNNAGLSNSKGVMHFLEMDEAHWDEVLRTNLKSVFLCSSAAAAHMVERRVEGTIINISSFTSQRAHRRMAAYDATKGAIEAFTRAVALDLAPYGVRVNAVAPGTIHVDEHEAEGPEARIRRAETVPLGRVGNPSDIGAAVAFLASDDADYITGQVIYVDGGMLAQLRSPQVDTPPMRKRDN